MALSLSVLLFGAAQEQGLNYGGGPRKQIPSKSESSGCIRHLKKRTNVMAVCVAVIANEV